MVPTFMLGRLQAKESLLYFICHIVDMPIFNCSLAAAGKWDSCEKLSDISKETLVMT